MDWEAKDVIELLKALPGILQSLLLVTLVGLLWVFRNPIKQNILPRLAGVKIFGVEFQLMKSSLDEAGKSLTNVKMSEDDKWSALKRAARVRSVLEGARLLWVDDHPEGNTRLAKVLRKLGVTVDLAAESDEALEMLRRHHYDVVVSDIARDKGTSGLDMLGEMARRGLRRWTILYVRDVQRTLPDNAFAITNRPDHLLHYVMDALERERWTDQ